MLKVNMVKVVELLKKGYEECGTYRALADKIGQVPALSKSLVILAGIRRN